MDTELKFRSVCDACAKSKVKCVGKNPCDRCARKGMECHFRPIKSRKGKRSKNNSILAETADDEFCFADHEKKTWSVFFSLYKMFKNGCAAVWFNVQLLKMLRFLEQRAAIGESLGAYQHLKSWISALRIDINTVIAFTNASAIIPHFRFDQAASTVFEATLDDLKADATSRNLAVLSVSPEGIVEVNDSFLSAFPCTKGELQTILDESNGGFLPWAGDVLASVFCSERDLSLYLQMVSMNIEQLGKPTSIPTTRYVPSTLIINVSKKGSLEETPCIVKSVQAEQIGETSFYYSTTIVFDFPNDVKLEQIPVESRIRTFENIKATPYASTIDNNKRLQEVKEHEEDIIFGLDDLSMDNDADEQWLGDLLTWASEDSDVVTSPSSDV